MLHLSVKQTYINQTKVKYRSRRFSTIETIHHANNVVSEVKNDIKRYIVDLFILCKLYHLMHGYFLLTRIKNV